MAATFNQWIGLGHLARDPELRYTATGTAVATCAVGINREWTGPDGQKKKECCFINLVAFDKTAEAMSNWMEKGTQVMVTGRLSVSEWEDKQSHEKRNAVKVVVERCQIIGKGKQSTAPASEPSETIADRKRAAQAEAGMPPSEKEDDVPF